MVSVALTDRCYRRGEKSALSRFANAHHLSELRGLLSRQRHRDRSRGAPGALRALPQRLAPGAATRSSASRHRAASCRGARAGRRRHCGRLQVRVRAAVRSCRHRSAGTSSSRARSRTRTGRLGKWRPGGTLAGPIDRNTRGRRSTGRRRKPSPSNRPRRSARSRYQPSRHRPPTSQPAHQPRPQTSKT